MDCSSARQHLSAFHDGELLPELRAAVAEHVAGCHECARSLGDFRELSRAAAELTTPAISSSADIWPELERKLDAEARAQRGLLFGLLGKSRVWAGVAAAVLVLVGISISIVVWTVRSTEHRHEHVAAEFGHFLDEFDRDPDAAQQVLVANYEGRVVSLDEATRELHYRPVAPQELPDGSFPVAIYLLRMPCCTCVQTIYTRKGGGKLAVFEHVDDQPGWFGDRPMIKTRCNGMPTSLVQVDDHLAASWQRRGRYVTVVGARDVEQVAKLVTFLDGQQPDNRPN